MPRTSLALRTAAAALALVAGGLLAAPAHASEASDAYRQAMALEKAVQKARNDESAEAAAKQQLVEFATSKSALLEGQKASLSKLDLMYLGLLQAYAGDSAKGIATLHEAVNKDEETKYGANIHANLVQALLDADQPDGAAAEVEKMQALYPDAKETKIAVMNTGMAYRGVPNHEKAAKWLRVAMDMGNSSATKPLVNSLLMAGKKDEAVQACKDAVEKGVPQLKEDMQTLLAITEKHHTDVSSLVKFDAFIPNGEPETKDRVLVLGFWNVSSRSFRNTLKLLDQISKGYQGDVCCIAATTYYKKDAESGKIDENMSPEVERSWGSKLRDQENWTGWMGYLPNEQAVKDLGVSALPHFVVVGKDGTLLFAHTMDFSGGGATDVAILKKVLNLATGRD